MGHRREAELQALYGGEDGLTLISSRSGRKRDKRTALRDRMSGMLAGRPSTINEAGMPTDAPVLGSYQKGTLESYLEGTLRSPGPRVGLGSELMPAGDATPEMLEQLSQSLGGLGSEVRSPDPRTAERGKEYTPFTTPKGTMEDEIGMWDLIKEMLGMEPEIPKGEPGLFSPKVFPPAGRE